MPTKGYNLLVRMRRYGKWWVMKGLKSDFADNNLYQTLLRKEFDILIQLQHPNIVSSSGWGEIEGVGHCIIMEWVDGVSLDQWLLHPHTQKECLSIAYQLLDAVGYLHGRQIVHRDIKPSNILITRNGNHVKLIDFGLSDTDSYTILKQPAGTEGYVSPEQKVVSETDIRNDIYSIGCILKMLRLGWRYRSVVARCCAPLHQRYAHCRDVQKALSRQQYLYPQIGIVLCLSALLIGVFVYRQHDIKQLYSRPQQTILISDSTPHIQKETDSVRSQQKGQEYQQQVDQMIVQGKRFIDERVDKLGIEQVLDTVTSQVNLGTAIVDALEQMPPTIEVYLQQLPTTLGENELATIREALFQYYDQRYSIRWVKRQSELPMI